MPTKKSLRITSWNINSVRIRLANIARYTREMAPDIICLQETKVEDGLFPRGELEKLGFAHLHFSGQKSYNGVAFLSKIPLKDVASECMAGSDHRRHITATLPDGTRLHNVYVPAGGDIPDPEANDKFAFKLRYMERLCEWADRESKNARLVLMGDINIAPLPEDVWSHKQMLKIVSHTPVEVEWMERLRATLGWVDSARHFTPAEEKLYSWWSYRNRDWALSNRGRRLDHIWVTPNLKDSLRSVHTHKDARGWESPSDHVPVMMELAL